MNIKYRRGDADSMADLSHMVEMSAEYNTPVRHPDFQWLDWKTFISKRYRALKGISKFYHFRWVFFLTHC